jgi:hypothetical protein
MDTPKNMERRRFVRMMAASGAALLAGPLAHAAPARARKPAASAPLPDRARRPGAAMRAEIANQKRSLAGALKIVREFELPPGSPPAFVFRALRARGRR